MPKSYEGFFIWKNTGILTVLTCAFVMKVGKIPVFSIDNR